MQYIAFDIETIPNEKALEFFTVHKNYSAPSNYKDEEKIKAYIDESRIEDFNKAGLYWWTGKIICITLHHVLRGDKKAFYGEDELQLLTEFFTFLKNECAGCHLIGKSSDHFDIPFILGRALAHDLGIPQILRTNWAKINDVDKIFAFSKACSQVSTLNAYAFGLGIKQKLRHGSQVKQMHSEGLTEEIMEYCQQDTDIVAEMIRRFTKDF